MGYDMDGLSGGWPTFFLAAFSFRFGPVKFAMRRRVFRKLKNYLPLTPSTPNHLSGSDCGGDPLGVAAYHGIHTQPPGFGRLSQYLRR